MACVQQVSSSQQTQLLPNQVATQQQSLVVVKKLLAIAVSGITYLRGLFPEKAYGSKYVEEQKVMILREERSCPGAAQIVQWMQGCFEAIEKTFLRAVILSIYTDPEHPERVTEFYKFRIQYTEKGTQVDFESNNNNNNKLSAVSCSSSRKSSVLLVRKLYTLMQNLGPLPDNVYLNMKLAYNHHVTPQDYQPPGFKEADSDAMEFEKEPVKLTMGEVATPFHRLRVDMATERHRLEQVEEQGVCVNEKWVLTMEEEDVSSQTVVEDVEEKEKETTDRAEIQLTCDEKMGSCEELNSEVDTLLKKTSDMETGLKRTSSGRVTRSTSVMNISISNTEPKVVQEKSVSQYQLPNSQDAPPTSTPKKRKFSEPKDHF
ncbi:HORMA domain-containing protein 1 [Genypterus blacodes]|uniref:HORMA domain-containing protein 1 n=1 Tax=Genypterus blacodes TaxID=154954 RepID=UPI003F76ED48